MVRGASPMLLSVTVCASLVAPFCRGVDERTVSERQVGCRSAGAIVKQILRPQPPNINCSNLDIIEPRERAASRARCWASRSR